MKTFDPNYKLLDEMYQDDYYPSLYYRVVVIKAPLQGLCYTVRDAVDWCFSPTTRMVSERFQPQPLTLLLIS